MNYEEAIAAFEHSKGKPILVRTKSGKKYWLYKDIVEAHNFDRADPLVYGTPETFARGCKRDFYWFRLANVNLV